ncbi:MAG: GNAT family N-acetyltransferase [Acetobacterium sp.]
MNNKPITIRMATANDAVEILAVYAPYVTDTAITFEYDIPEIDDFTKRIKHTLTKYPYLVAVRENRIVGYAYATAFKDRAAYDWAVEVTVYVSPDCQVKGIGKKLYIALEETLKKQNIINLNACITYPNPGSIGFHEHMGYKTVGCFTKCGYKLGTWYDMIWMEKIINKHPVIPNKVIPMTQL